MCVCVCVSCPACTGLVRLFNGREVGESEGDGRLFSPVQGAAGSRINCDTPPSLLLRHCFPPCPPFPCHPPPPFCSLSITVTPGSTRSYSAVCAGPRKRGCGRVRPTKVWSASAAANSSSALFSHPLFTSSVGQVEEIAGFQQRYGVS